RRVPSYLGLLLDVTRRNLDRVLYFAQYAIIRVDEDARQRALRRLEDEFQRERERIEHEMQAELERVQDELTSRVSEITDELLSVRGELDERLSTRTEAIMGEAKMLSASIENQMGKAAREDLTLSFGETSLLRQGETVTQDHAVRLNEQVQQELSRLQSEVADERQEAAERLDAV
ncbi:MAG: DNA-directed RNA polymerase subunit beta', partial [Gemmatimonadales bacterium]|nr:DNA-directed RNA polymerase subunit beta' [Gemmatimonadales bacterium]